MLILTRRPREVVMIGADIQVVVLDTGGDRVRLGITAPSELKILRKEPQPSSAQVPRADGPKPIAKPAAVRP